MKAIIADVDTMLALPNGVLLYLDEIGISTSQQQPAEVHGNGKITPHRLHHGESLFYVYNALLSRSTDCSEFKRPDGGGDSCPRKHCAKTLFRSRSPCP